MKQLFIVLIFLTSCTIDGMRKTKKAQSKEYDTLVEELKKEVNSHDSIRNKILTFYIPLWEKEQKEGKRSAHPLSCAVARLKLENDNKVTCSYYPHSRRESLKNLVECFHKHIKKNHEEFFNTIDKGDSKTKYHTRSAPTPTRSKKLRASLKTEDEESKEESAIKTLSKEIATIRRSISEINHTIEKIKEEQSRINTALKDFKIEFHQKYTMWEPFPSDGF